MRVNITDHAHKRWLDYTNIKKTKHQLGINIKKRLHYELKSGLHMDNTGAVHMPYKFGLIAALVLDNNGWTVVTFHHNDYNFVNDGITYADRYN